LFTKFYLSNLACSLIVTRRLDLLFLSRYRACCPHDVLRAVFTLR